MLTETDLAIAACFFLGAALYSSVGHAGASAYIAIMALFGVAPAVMRPTALVLNVLVSTLASVRYTRAGLFRWRTVWPFLLGAIPMAFLGGTITLPAAAYRPIVGVVLLIAAARFLMPPSWLYRMTVTEVPILTGIVLGVGIGFLSGLTGTGGGIFLTPLILIMGWSASREASGISAVFILCNSAAGLSGQVASLQSLPAALPLHAAAVLLGGWAGTSFGISQAAAPYLPRLLAAVLIIAGLKMIGVY